MTYASVLIILITSLGFLQFKCNKFTKLKLKTLAPGVLTLNIIAFGTLHFLIGVCITFVLGAMAGILVEDFNLGPVQLKSWDTAFYYLGLDYQVPPAIAIILIAAFGSARYGYLVHGKSKHLSKLPDIEQVNELVDNDLDQFLVDALRLENSTVFNGNVPNVRVVLQNRKVYIGNLISCDVKRGLTRSIVLQPNHSGFLTEDSLELVFTEHYESFFKERLTDKQLINDKGETSAAQRKLIEKFYNKFAVTIPVEEIMMLSLFDMDEYVRLLDHKYTELQDVEDK